MTTDTIDITTEIDAAEKEVALKVLAESGLNMADLLRMAVHETARLKRVPFESNFDPSYFDIERMKGALAFESIMAPSGINSEEIRQFILSHGKRKKSA